jgi:hypothetical protein
MQRTNPYFDDELDEDLADLPSEILEAYLDVTRTHHKLLERLAQR